MGGGARVASGEQELQRVAAAVEHLGQERPGAAQQAELRLRLGERLEDRVEQTRRIGLEGGACHHPGVAVARQDAVLREGLEQTSQQTLLGGDDVQARRELRRCQPVARGEGESQLPEGRGDAAERGRLEPLADSRHAGAIGRQGERRGLRDERRVESRRGGEPVGARERAAGRFRTPLDFVEPVAPRLALGRPQRRRRGRPQRQPLHLRDRRAGVVEQSQVGGERPRGIGPGSEPRVAPERARVAACDPDAARRHRQPGGARVARQRRQEHLEAGVEQDRVDEVAAVGHAFGQADPPERRALAAADRFDRPEAGTVLQAARPGLLVEGVGGDRLGASGLERGAIDPHGVADRGRATRPDPPAGSTTHCTVRSWSVIRSGRRISTSSRTGSGPSPVAVDARSISMKATAGRTALSNTRWSAKNGGDAASDCVDSKITSSGRLATAWRRPRRGCAASASARPGRVATGAPASSRFSQWRRASNG